MLFFGYTTSRPFGGFCMPVPAQNSCLREYCDENKGKYVLPQLEHKYHNCYMQLFSTLNSCSQNSAILMYSILMMEMNKDKTKYFFEIIKKKNVQIHFVLENKIANSLEEFYKMSQNYKFKKFIISRKTLKERTLKN